MNCDFAAHHIKGTLFHAINLDIDRWKWLWMLITILPLWTYLLSLMVCTCISVRPLSRSSGGIHTEGSVIKNKELSGKKNRSLPEMHWINGHVLLFKPRATHKGGKRGKVCGAQLRGHHREDSNNKFILIMFAKFYFEPKHSLQLIKANILFIYLFFTWPKEFTDPNKLLSKVEFNWFCLVELSRGGRMGHTEFPLVVRILCVTKSQEWFVFRLCCWSKLMYVNAVTQVT